MRPVVISPKQKELSTLKFTPEKEADLVKRKGTEEEIIASLRAVSYFVLFVCFPSQILKLLLPK